MVDKYSRIQLFVFWVIVTIEHGCIYGNNGAWVYIKMIRDGYENDLHWGSTDVSAWWIFSHHRVANWCRHWQEVEHFVMVIAFMLAATTWYVVKPSITHIFYYLNDLVLHMTGKIKSISSNIIFVWWVNLELTFSVVPIINLFWVTCWGTSMKLFTCLCNFLSFQATILYTGEMIWFDFN